MRGLLAALASTGILALGSVAMAAESKGGMPQLDFKNPLTTSQVVWLAIIFATLYLLLSRWALPKLGAVLEMRAATISGDLEAAQSAKLAADAAVGELNNATRIAQGTAQAEISRAVTAAKEAAEREAAVQNARLAAQLSAAEQRIAASRTSAMGALQQIAAETASVVVARLTGASPDGASVDQAVHAVRAMRRV